MDAWRRSRSRRRLLASRSAIVTSAPSASASWPSMPTSSSTSTVTVAMSDHGSGRRRRMLPALESFSDREQGRPVVLVEVVPDAIETALRVIAFRDRRAIGRRLQPEHLVHSGYESALHRGGLEQQDDRAWRGAYTSRQFGLGDPPSLKQRFDVRLPHVVDGNEATSRAGLARHGTARCEHGHHSVGLTGSVQTC